MFVVRAVAIGLAGRFPRAHSPRRGWAPGSPQERRSFGGWGWLGLGQGLLEAGLREDLWFLYGFFMASLCFFFCISFMDSLWFLYGSGFGVGEFGARAWWGVANLG